MQRQNSHLLLHPLFVINLLLLIANDHWWKYEFPNILTGKLSDFSGLFVLAVFLISCFPSKRIFCIGFTAIFFIWWKSSLSEPFIQGADQWPGIRLVRVIDYSDFFALAILPVAWKLKPWSFSGYPVLRRYAIAIIGFIAVAAMMATTVPRMYDYSYPRGFVSVYKSWKTPLTTDQFFEKLDSLGISYRKDSLELLPVDRSGYVLRTKTDTGFKWQALDYQTDSTLYFLKQTPAFYEIPYLALDKDTITQVRFMIFDQGKKRRIELRSMVIPPDFEQYYYMKRPVRKKYLAIFKSFMLE